MKLPGINYNWNVTPTTKADVYAPIKIAGAKSQMAGALSTAAGSTAQVAQSFNIADQNRLKKEDEMRQVQAAQDIQISNDERKFRWDEASKGMSDFDYQWQLGNAGETTYSASQVGEGVIPENRETKPIVVDGEVVEVENDEIPAWKVQPDMYRRDALANLEAQASKIGDWEDQRAFTQAGQEQIDTTYLKMNIAAKGQAQAYMVGKSEADINEAQDQGRFDLAGAQIDAYPGDPNKQQKLREDNKTKQEKWLYQDAINVRSIDAMNTYKDRLQSDDYQDEFGGLNQDEKASYINTFERLINAKKAQDITDAKANNGKYQYDVDQAIESLESGKYVGPEYISDAKAKAKFLKDDKRIARLDSADTLQTQFLGVARLPTKSNKSLSENVRNKAKSPESINRAEDLVKMVDKSNAARDDNVVDWYDGLLPDKVPDIRQDENEADDIRTRSDLANKLRGETGVYTGFLKKNEVVMEANRIESLDAEGKYNRAVFMQDAIPEDIRGYTNQLMQNGVGGSFPIAMNILSDGKPQLAKEILKGEEIRSNNKDIGVNYKSNANLEFSQITGNAYDGTPTERGRVFEASLDIMAARSPGTDAGTWDSERYKEIIMELSDGIVEMDGNNFVRKPSATMPDRDFFGWIDTMDYTEIDTLASAQNVELSKSSKSLVKGVRNGDITLKGPYNGGYLLFDVKSDRLISDKNDPQTPFIMSYDDKFITETEAGRTREAVKVGKTKETVEAQYQKELKTAGLKDTEANRRAIYGEIEREVAGKTRRQSSSDKRGVRF